MLFCRCFGSPAGTDSLQLDDVLVPPPQPQPQHLAAGRGKLQPEVEPSTPLTCAEPTARHSPATCLGSIYTLAQYGADPSATGVPMAPVPAGVPFRASSLKHAARSLHATSSSLLDYGPSTGPVSSSVALSDIPSPLGGALFTSLFSGDLFGGGHESGSGLHSGMSTARSTALTEDSALFRIFQEASRAPCNTAQVSLLRGARMRWCTHHTG